MPWMACCHRRARRHVVRVGVDADLVEACRSCAPVSGSNSVIDSSSSPKNDSRQARSSRWAGQISSASPRTRKTPRAKAASLRRYCWATRSAMHLALVVGLALEEVLGHRRVGLDRADAVDAGHRGDDDDVVALEQRPGGRVAHPVDLLVDLGFLLDVGVRPRHVGLGLVVVVVGDEVLDRVVGEEALELAVELGGERLVGREDDRRALGLPR